MNHLLQNKSRDTKNLWFFLFLALSILLHASVLIFYEQSSYSMDFTEIHFRISQQQSQSSHSEIVLQTEALFQRNKLEDNNLSKPENASFPSDVLETMNQQIQNSIVYPPMAVKMGWEGNTRIEVRIQADGNVDGLSILQSSGHSILDRAAENGIRAYQFPKSNGRKTATFRFQFQLQ